MSKVEPVKSPLSPRRNPQRVRVQAAELKEKIQSKDGIFFNIILPVRTHALIKLYSIWNQDPMSKIMSRVVVSWVMENLTDLGSAKKITVPEGDLRGTINCGILLPRDIHAKIKLAASIHRINMREVVIPILDAWCAENCTGPDYSEERIKAVSRS